MKVWYSSALALGLLACNSCSSPAENNSTVIRIHPQSDPLEQLAAREIRRYLYLRTGVAPRIERRADSAPGPGQVIALLTEGRPSAGMIAGTSERGSAGDLDAQGFRLKTVGGPSGRMLVVAGGSPIGTLYGAYRLAEELGVRFYPHGDVIPDRRAPAQLPILDLQESPHFATRGIQPFHDFPEGPDWWNLDDYKAVLAQLAKMRMNFIGFHTYPAKPFEGWSKAEPMVWIGLADQVGDAGEVRSAYPVLHAHTLDETWAYDPRPTSEFLFGAGELFETDNFGADYMKGVSAWPHSEQENLEIFRAFGELQRDAFSFARRLGIQTCLGTETPLVLPGPVVGELQKRGIDPASDAAIRAAYEGIFTRIQRLFPLDYYWLWTPETWTWEEVPDRDVERTERDILLAVEAARKVGVEFRLATSGWVLGPPADRAQFDRTLPKEMPFSCINREVGFAPVEPGFERVSGRSKWAIPWIEDDPALVSPQLWAGRVRRDARDAARYGCDGLLGIHWRTRILAPTFGALAWAGWRPGDTDEAPGSGRDLPVDDFYLDWSRANFGEEVAARVAPIFSRLDGGPLYVPGKGPRTARLYRTSDWAGKGPGGILVNSRPWEEVHQEFGFIEELASVLPDIQGAGNRERFEYWLNTFEYARNSARVGCLLGALKDLASKVEEEVDSGRRRSVILEQALPLRAGAAAAWGQMVTTLLSTVSTTGAMGTVANLEQHNLGNLRRLTEHDAVLEKVLGEPLPPLPVWTDYRGSSRLFLPTVRSILELDEDLRLKAIVLSQGSVQGVSLLWRRLGVGEFRRVEFSHAGRGVYGLSLPAALFSGEDLEYYVEARLESETLVWPATAPGLNQTAVVWSGD